MKVNGSAQSPIDRANDAGGAARVSETQDSKQKRKPPRAESPASDYEKVEISPRAKEAVKAKAAARSAPDIREDKVEKLRSAIEGGNYKIDADAVAEKMLAEHLSAAH